MRGLAAAIAAASLLAAAAPTSAEESSTCRNDGVITMVGASNAYTCNTTCHNGGIIVMVGPNTYACEGGCTNDGVLVNVGGSYCGSTAPEACLDDLCVGKTVVSCPLAACGALGSGSDCRLECLALPATDCRIHLHPRVEPRCGSPFQPCGIMEDPACWTLRFGCAMVGRAVVYYTDGLVGCQTQPGNNQTEGLQPLG